MLWISLPVRVGILRGGSVALPQTELEYMWQPGLELPLPPYLPPSLPPVTNPAPPSYSHPSLPLPPLTTPVAMAVYSGSSNETLT